MFSQSLPAEICKDNIVFVLGKLFETYRFRYCYLLHRFKCENIGHSRNVVGDDVDFGFVARSVEVVHGVDVLTEISVEFDGRFGVLAIVLLVLGVNVVKIVEQIVDNLIVHTTHQQCFRPDGQRSGLSCGEDSDY